MNKRAMATVLGALLLAACGGSGSPSGSSGTPAAAGGTGCAFATKEQAGAALGKPTLEGNQEDKEKCFFAAADTHAATASEYVNITVTKEESADDARTTFEALAGPTPAAVAGLGDSAAFKRDGNDSTISVLKGTATVLVEVRGAAQADPQGALKTLAGIVLGKV